MTRPSRRCHHRGTRPIRSPRGTASNAWDTSQRSDSTRRCLVALGCDRRGHQGRRAADPHTSGTAHPDDAPVASGIARTGASSRHACMPAKHRSTAASDSQWRPTPWRPSSPHGTLRRGGFPRGPARCACCPTTRCSTSCRGSTTGSRDGTSVRSVVRRGCGRGCSRRRRCPRMRRSARGASSPSTPIPPVRTTATSITTSTGTRRSV